MDWARLCHEAVDLGADDVAALERQLEADPGDVEARVKILGALWLGPNEERSARRGEHLAWLATHRPDIGLGGFGTLIAEYAPAQHAALSAAWRAAVEKPDVSIDIIANAASFLGFEAPEEGEALYRRAASLEPKAPKWRERIAEKLLRRARSADDASKKKALAVAAITELDAALECPSNASTALNIRISLLAPLVMAEAWERAATTAERVLADNELAPKSWQYGNGIHHAQLTLGWCAHARCDLAAAGEHLLRAGATPGSPQLNSFGPDFDLARALLHAGERAVVREYLVACGAFWEGERRKNLAKWLAAIDRGEETSLERHYGE